MKIFLCLFTFILSGVYCYGQNYNLNNNVNQNTVVVAPVSERVIVKTEYVDRYRTVYVDRPQPKRVARKLSAPVLLHGYLWVYTEDIGNFESQRDALEIIGNINISAPFGRNNWRIPTSAELSVLEQNANAVGLGDDIYLATDHANGVLRMVSTGLSVAEQQVEYQRQIELERIAEEQRQAIVRQRQANEALAEERRKAEIARVEEERKAEEARRAAVQKRQAEAAERVDRVMIDYVVWATRNVNTYMTFTTHRTSPGRLYSYKDAVSACPSGWRLPTENEFKSLIRAGSKRTTLNGVDGYILGGDNSALFFYSGAGSYIGANNSKLALGRDYAYTYSDPLDYDTGRFLVRCVSINVSIDIPYLVL